MMRGRQIVWPERKIAFFTVPKCASMSVAYTFQAAVGSDWKRWPVHMPEKPFIFADWKEFDRYAIVRNPIQRFLSGHAFCKPDADIEELLEDVLETPDHAQDQHFRSQASFLTTQSGVFLPNKLLKFEDLPGNWPLEWPLHHRNKTDKKLDLSEGLKSRLAERFADDFALWEAL